MRAVGRNFTGNDVCVEDEVDTELRVSSCAVTALEKRRREGGLLATFSDISRLRLLLPLELLQQPSPSVSDKWQRCENALNKNKKSVTLFGPLGLYTKVQMCLLMLAMCNTMTS